MFLYLLLLPPLQLISSFVDILEDPRQFFFSRRGFLLDMTQLFGMEVVGLHGLVELQMSLTIV